MTGAGDFDNKNFEEFLVEAAAGQWGPGGFLLGTWVQISIVYLIHAWETIGVRINIQRLIYYI